MIISRLEKIASTLESKGMTEEAAIVDSVCNSIEKNAQVEKTFQDIYKANKIEFNNDENRYATVEEPPQKVIEYFEKGTDGNWYLQDTDHVHLEKGPQNSIKVHRSYKDPGTVVPGLTPLMQ